MASKFSIKVFAVEAWDPDDHNLDVEVTLSDGRRYSGTFFTIENIRSLFEKNRATGECASGLYLWAVDMIIVERLTMEVIEKTVTDLLESGELGHVMQLLPEPPDPDSGQRYH